jgi:hypothetical protein
MIDIIQGETQKLTFNLQTETGEQVDPASLSQITVEFYHEGGSRVLAKYAYPSLPGYRTGALDSENKTVIFYIEGADTRLFPMGRIIGRVTMKMVDANYVDGFNIRKARDAIFNVLS